MSEQTYANITHNELHDKISKMKKTGFSLSQICATDIKDGFEILYSLEMNYELVNLRLIIEKDDIIESVCGIFPYAFLYENEMKDLFGIKINNVCPDFKGTLYKIAVKEPFNSAEK